MDELSLFTDRIILDLCGGTGAWSDPWRDGGFDVRVVTLPQDVRFYVPPAGVYGVLAAPPCTCFANSGARWHRSEADMLEALSVVDACLRIILVSKPVFWALENPVGKLKGWLGSPVMYFNPCDYGDPYTKKTALWGNFTIPEKTPVDPVEGSKMALKYGGKSKRTKELRSITPPGFAKAFYKANRSYCDE